MRHEIHVNRELNIRNTSDFDQTYVIPIICHYNGDGQRTGHHEIYILYIYIVMYIL